MNQPSGSIAFHALPLEFRLKGVGQSVGAEIEGFILPLTRLWVMLSKLRSAVSILRSEGSQELLSRSYDYLGFIPCRWGTEMNRKYYGFFAEEYNMNGIDIFQEDWDNLIILDACRFDKFEELNTISGTLTSKTSRGSTTWEFLRGSFQEKQLDDTVYITDNPWFLWMSDELNSSIHQAVSLERNRFDGVVTDAETMTDRAIKFAEKHANKRVIAHYLQPHAPFFSIDGDELFELPSSCYFGVRRSRYSVEEIEQAYEENLRYVLSHIPRLLDNLEGKTVITADHGELLGERISPVPIRRFEHPEGIYVKELVDVPWFVADHSGRKDIVSDQPIGNEDGVDREESKEILKSLGYL